MSKHRIICGLLVTMVVHEMKIALGHSKCWAHFYCWQVPCTLSNGKRKPKHTIFESKMLRFYYPWANKQSQHEQLEQRKIICTGARETELVTLLTNQTAAPKSWLFVLAGVLTWVQAWPCATLRHEKGSVIWPPLMDFGSLHCMKNWDPLGKNSN